MLENEKLKEINEYVASHLELENIIYQKESLLSHVSEAVKSHAIDEYIDTHEEPTFHSVLFDFIDEKSFTDVDVYKKAWIDRRHFSKIRSNLDYNIGKNSVISLVLALELSPKDAGILINSAGFSLSNSNKSDLVVKFCLENKIYKIYDVNLALDSLDLDPL